MHSGSAQSTPLTWLDEAHAARLCIVNEHPRRLAHTQAGEDDGVEHLRRPGHGLARLTQCLWTSIQDQHMCACQPFAPPQPRIFSTSPQPPSTQRTHLVVDGLRLRQPCLRVLHQPHALPQNGGEHVAEGRAEHRPYVLHAIGCGGGSAEVEWGGVCQPGGAGAGGTLRVERVG